MEKKVPSYTVGTATIENSMEVPQKTKIELSSDPAIPLLGIYPDKTITQRYMHPYIHSSTIHNSQDMETTYISINRWMDKEDRV